MTEKRKKKIFEEGKRRVDIILDNISFELMTCNGSLTIFDMNLGLNGYPFKPVPSFIKGQKFKKVVSDEEFDTSDYDLIIDELYKYAESRCKIC